MNLTLYCGSVAYALATGSEFEQTNDYKNYQFDGTNWVERGTAI